MKNISLNSTVTYENSDRYSVPNKWQVTAIADTTIGKRYTIENLVVDRFIVSGVKHTEIAEV